MPLIERIVVGFSSTVNPISEGCMLPGPGRSDDNRNLQERHGDIVFGSKVAGVHTGVSWQVKSLSATLILKSL
jgi:hypothetical protein